MDEATELKNIIATAEHVMDEVSPVSADDLVALNDLNSTSNGLNAKHLPPK